MLLRRGFAWAGGGGYVASVDNVGFCVDLRGVEPLDVGAKAANVHLGLRGRVVVCVWVGIVSELDGRVFCGESGIVSNYVEFLWRDEILVWRTLDVCRRNCIDFGQLHLGLSLHVCCM